MKDREGNSTSSFPDNGDNNEQFSKSQGNLRGEPRMDPEIARKEAKYFYNLINSIGDQADFIGKKSSHGGVKVAPGVMAIDADIFQGLTFGVLHARELVDGFGTGDAEIRREVDSIETLDNQRFTYRYLLEVHVHSDERTKKTIESLIEANPDNRDAIIAGLGSQYFFGENGEYVKLVSLPQGIIDERISTSDAEETEDGHMVFANITSGDFETVGLILHKLKQNLQDYKEGIK